MTWKRLSKTYIYNLIFVLCFDQIFKLIHLNRQKASDVQLKYKGSKRINTHNVNQKGKNECAKWAQPVFYLRRVIRHSSGVLIPQILLSPLQKTTRHNMFFSICLTTVCTTCRLFIYLFICAR